MRMLRLTVATSAVPLILCTACITIVNPVDPPAEVHLRTPLFDVIEIEGLTTREREVIARGEGRGAHCPGSWRV